MTNVISGGSSIRNRTSRLSSRMKSVREVEDDNTTTTSAPSPRVTTTTIAMAPDNPQPPPGAAMEDSSSSMDELGQHQKVKQTALPPVQVPHYRRNQHHQQPDGGTTTSKEINNRHRNNNTASSTGTSTAAQQWGKHIEEGISGILKRLDELAMARENGIHQQSRRPWPSFILGGRFTASNFVFFLLLGPAKLINPIRTLCEVEHPILLASNLVSMS